MRSAKSKQDFISKLESKGYEIKWTDTRKTITYTTPNGKSCRDDKLFESKYLKSNMELEFDIRNGFQTDELSGWEKPQEPSYEITSKSMVNDIMHMAGSLKKFEHDEDDFETICAIGMLTALSAVGVYLLIEKLNQSKNIDNDKLEEIIFELQQEPENNLDYEEEQGFQMTM